MSPARRSRKRIGADLNFICGNRLISGEFSPADSERGCVRGILKAHGLCRKRLGWRSSCGSQTRGPARLCEPQHVGRPVRPETGQSVLPAVVAAGGHRRHRPAVRSACDCAVGAKRSLILKPSASFLVVPGERHSWIRRKSVSIAASRWGESGAGLVPRMLHESGAWNRDSSRSCRRSAPSGQSEPLQPADAGTACPQISTTGNPRPRRPGRHGRGLSGPTTAA